MSAAKAVTSSWHRPSASATAGKNVAGQYRVAEPLDFFHFAKRRIGFTNWCWQPEPKPAKLQRQPAAMMPTSTSSRSAERRQPVLA